MASFSKKNKEGEKCIHCSEAAIELERLLYLPLQLYVLWLYVDLPKVVSATLMFMMGGSRLGSGNPDMFMTETPAQRVGSE